MHHACTGIDEAARMRKARAGGQGCACRMGDSWAEPSAHQNQNPAEHGQPLPRQRLKLF